ncbi:MAG: phage portal protein [Methylobacterium sp.]|nr:phage portal protein [Methylobacterium sp.]
MLDRAINVVAPVYGARRMQARVQIAMAGQYAGAKSNKTALKSWQTNPGSADADTLGDLTTLRARSRDLGRNNPIARGARATAKSHTVGTGLKLRSQIDREMLGLTEEQAEKWERNAEKLFDLWACSTACDVSLTQNFYQLQGLVFDTTFESGDSFILRRKAKMRSVVSLALAVIEADRVDTPQSMAADPDIRSGVRIDEDGAPLSYFFLSEHPGDHYFRTYLDYQEIPAFGQESGERMVLHVYRRLRPEQTRGVPELAPIIEILKQLDRYTEAEIMAAVVSSFFTVFVKSDSGDDVLAGATDPLPGMGKDEITLGSGAIVSIGKEEDVVAANPARNNSNFDPFMSAILRQIGVALSIPYELLVMHFEASYSASRAALEMAAKFFAERREWLVTTFCQPVYEWFLTDAINAGLIDAPGFFGSAVRRAAWAKALWKPPTGLVIDPVKEAEADKLNVDLGVTTLESVTLTRNGGDWKQVTEQRGREHAARVAAKLEPEILDPSKTGLPKPEPEAKPKKADA